MPGDDLIMRQIPEVLEVRTPARAAVPVVFDSPHSGQQFPSDFRPAATISRLRRTIDAHVDELFEAAPSRGASLLCARFARCYIDPNRAPNDIDETLLDRPWPQALAPSEKVRLGIGLITRRDPIGPIYDRRLSVDEVRHRLDNYYHPYHRTLSELIASAHRRHGVVWHVNCHSMKSLGANTTPDAAGVRRTDFCLGDRDGTGCAPEFTELVADSLRTMGYTVAVNDPYRGVEIVRRYANPGQARHSLQIEVKRALYMNERTVQKHGGFACLKSDIGKLIEIICNHARRGIEAATAAE